MKKLLSVILAIAMLASSFVISVTASDETEDDTVSIVFDTSEKAEKVIAGNGDVYVLLGDIDRDGEVSSKDSRAIKLYIAGISEDIDEIAGDLDGDGEVTSKDSLLLKKLLTDLVKPEDLPAASLHPASGSGCSAASFDASEKAALVSASAGSDISVRIVPDEIAEGFDTSDYKFAGILYKASSATEGAVYALPIEDGENTVTFNTASSDTYQLKLFDMRENGTWNGEKESIGFDLLTGAEQGDNVLIDSFILTDSKDALETFATERLKVRNYPDLTVADGTSAGGSAVDNIEVLFTDSENLALVSAPFHATYEFNESANCLALTVSTEKTDPQAYLDLESFGASANDYKYVVYTYKNIAANKKQDAAGELFLCAGDIKVPTGGCSKIFNLTTDGKFHSAVIDMSGESYWKGTIHGIRMDFFCDAFAGDTSFVKSVILCKTRADADNAASMMSGTVSTSGIDAKGASEYLFKSATKDASNTAYIGGTKEDPIIAFTGGTVNRFTKTHLESRLHTFILASIGADVNVEVLDGYNELYEQYAENECSDGYVIYKLTDSNNAFRVLFSNTSYDMKKIIIDHDLGPDCDDASAISIVAKAHRNGEVNCLAITSCMYTEYSAYAAAAIVDYLGIDDIPIAWNNQRSTTGGNVRCCKIPATNYWNRHGPWPTLYFDTPLLRQILADNNKKDITLLTTGPLTSIYCLFNSGADSISEKTGRELFSENISLYVVGGGNFKNNGDSDHNFVEDFEATDAVVNKCPSDVPMIFAGGNLAGDIYTGGVLSRYSDDWIVKGCYYYQNWETGNYGRNSWDLAYANFAVYGGCNGLWEVRHGYNITSWTDGSIVVSAGGDRSYVVALASEDVLGGMLSGGMIPD